MTRATVTRRLCTVAGFCKYVVEEELLEHSLAAHVRRPRVDYESHAVALDRNELGVLLVAAGLGWLDALTRAAEGSPWIPETG
jgi:integrase/recombinase XerD